MIFYFSFLIAAISGLSELDVIFPNDCFTGDQNGGWQNPVFREDRVGRIDLTYDDPEIPPTLPHSRDKVYHDVKVHFDNGLISEQFDKAAAKIRGGFSITFPKKSFTVSLFKNNKKSDGHSFHGLTKLVLRAAYFDPSKAREFLTLDLLRSMGICVQRKAFVQLFVDNQYWGIYLMTEPFDEQFSSVRFSGRSAGVFKWNWQCALDPAFYGYAGVETSVLKSPDDDMSVYAPLVPFGQLINGDPEEFSLKNVKRSAVSEAVTNGFDSMTAQCNNGYLLVDAARFMIKYVPYDLDISFGAGPIDQVDRLPPQHWLDGLFAVPQQSTDARSRFQLYLQRAVQLFASDSMAQRIDAVYNLLKPFYGASSDRVYEPVKPPFSGSSVADWFERAYWGADGVTGVYENKPFTVPGISLFVKQTPAWFASHPIASGGGAANFLPSIVSLTMNTNATLPQQLAGAAVFVDFHVVVTVAADSTATDSYTVDGFVLGREFEPRRVPMKKTSSATTDGPLTIAEFRASVKLPALNPILLPFSPEPDEIPSAGLFGYYATLTSEKDGKPVDVMPPGSPGKMNRFTMVNGQRTQNAVGSKAYFITID